VTRRTAIESVRVAAYIEHLQKERSAPTAKLRLAALRHLFDWMVIGQIMPLNPAAAVRGPPQPFRHKR
jgi:site-specific recombinase XerC